jgi:hypothetical protein
MDYTIKTFFFILLALFVLDVASSGSFTDNITFNTIHFVLFAIKEILFSIRYTA